MAKSGNEKPDWFTIFRTDEENAGWLYTELTEGRLRQGWGAPGLDLKTAAGRRVEKAEWEEKQQGTLEGRPEPQALCHSDQNARHERRRRGRGTEDA